VAIVTGRAWMVAKAQALLISKDIRSLSAYNYYYSAVSRDTSNMNYPMAAAMTWHDFLGSSLAGRVSYGQIHRKELTAPTRDRAIFDFLNMDKGKGLTLWCRCHG